MVVTTDSPVPRDVVDEIAPLRRLPRRPGGLACSRARYCDWACGARVAALHHVPQPGAAQLGLEVPVGRVGRDALLAHRPQRRLGRGVELGERAGRAGRSSSSGVCWARRSRARCCSTILLISGPDVGGGLADSGRRRAAGTSPANTSKVRRIVFGACSVSASTSATSSRGTGPRRPSAVETSTRPLPGPFCRLPGRTIVQSSVLAATRASASAFARRYGPHRLRPGVRVLRADRGDDHEAGDAERLGGLDALDRGAEVDGALALGARARARRRPRTRSRRRRPRAGARRRARGRRAPPRRRRPRCRRRAPDCGSGRGRCARRAPAGG